MSQHVPQANRDGTFPSEVPAESELAERETTTPPAGPALVRLRPLSGEPRCRVPRSTLARVPSPRVWSVRCRERGSGTLLKHAHSRRSSHAYPGSANRPCVSCREGGTSSCLPPFPALGPRHFLQTRGPASGYQALSQAGVPVARHSLERDRPCAPAVTSCACRAAEPRESALRWQT